MIVVVPTIVVSVASVVVVSPGNVVDVAGTVVVVVVVGVMAMMWRSNNSRAR